MAGFSGSKQSMEVIDLTLSDTDEPTASDTASLAHLTDLLPTSAIDSVVETGPAVFAPKKEDDSTGPEVLEGAGFQGKRSRGSGRSGSPTKQPKKRTKNSARKSTHRVTDAQRKAWEAQHASIFASAKQEVDGRHDSPSDAESHEAAMQRAAAERRRSSSKKSPSKENAIAGPGPQTLALRQVGKLDDIAIDSPPSRPNSSASSRPISPRPSGNTPVPYPAAPRASAFVASDEPGSWGHAVPMVVKPARSTPPPRPAPAPTPEPGSWGNAVPMVIHRKPDSRAPSQLATSIPGTAPSEHRGSHSGLNTALTDPAVDSVTPAEAPTARKGPKWATSAAVERLSTSIHATAAAPSIDAMPLATATEQEVADAIEVIQDGVRGVSLDRQVRAQSDDSIEEIPAVIAMSQTAFAQRTATQDRRPVVNEELSSLPSVLFANEVPFNAIAGPSNASSAPSKSGSPTKRHSVRLANRTETPIYEFRRNTSSPIRWRKAIEREEWSDSDKRDGRSRSSSSTDPTSVDQAMSVDEDIKIYPALPVDTPPPPDRTSRAVRTFDTRLVNEWNREYPKMTSNPGLHRLIFESYISECIQGAEPSITVHNDVDAESIPPNFEFQYANNMLYHSSVPEPELGLGCDCEGPCSENSTGCSCLRRQELYNYDVNKGFAYTKSGLLKINDVPIWECGPKCGCPPECMNRVIQRGRGPRTLVDLFKTRKKGWGVRARERIRKGTFLGIYSGELITEYESERRGTLYNLVGRTYLFDCDGWHIGNPPPEGLDELDPRLAELAANAKARAWQAYERDGEERYNAYSVDAFHYGFTRFFNHSCDPNLVITQAYAYDFHPERPLLVIFACKDIKANEELCISYKGLPDPESDSETPENSGKQVKQNKKTAKTTAAAHISSRKSVVDKDRCYCGTSKCDGIMFGTG